MKTKEQNEGATQSIPSEGIPSLTSLVIPFLKGQDLGYIPSKVRRRHMKSKEIMRFSGFM